MRVGIDVHDTFTYHPTFFREFISRWSSPVFFVTGTPASQRDSVQRLLADNGVPPSLYADILMGYEYDKSLMTLAHFKRMRAHKLRLCTEAGIDVYFDDNPFYAEYLRRHGILVFQPILNDKYVDEYSRKDQFFSCHLQKSQFRFLEELSDEDVLRESRQDSPGNGRADVISSAASKETTR